MSEYLTKEEVAATLHMSSRKAANALKVGKTTVNKYRGIYGLQRADRGLTEALPAATKPRILALDLETSPNVAHVWGLWNQNVSIKQLLESTEVICFGARWLGEDDVEIRSVHHDGKEKMIRRAYELIDEADVVMGWNSKNFDVKHLNREFVQFGLTPPSPTANLDLMVEVKRVFRFPSNKLDYVSRALGLEGKVQHSGHELWIRCLAGDEDAWAEMYEYQKQDVDLLIELYYRLLPWLKNHPNVGLWNDEEELCVACGSPNLQKRGFERTAVSTFQRYRCNDCGRWQHGFKRLGTTTMRR